MRRTILIAAAFALLTTTAHAAIYTVPADVSAGRLNIRSGPGTNHALVGAIPAGATIRSDRCVPRDDGINGASWCLVTFNGATGWASSAGLMPGYMPPGTSTPTPVPPGMDMRSGPYAAMPAQPAEDAEPNQVSLKCTPPLDRSDRNPIKAIYVTFVLDAPKPSITVMHQAWNGAMYSRADQYDATASYQDGIYGWKGAWLKNRNVIMSGGAFIGTDGRYYYREKQWKNGLPEADTTSSCIVID
jgi:hypothetical protein